MGTDAVASGVLGSEVEKESALSEGFLAEIKEDWAGAGAEGRVTPEIGVGASMRSVIPEGVTMVSLMPCASGAGCVRWEVADSAL